MSQKKRTHTAKKLLLGAILCVLLLPLLQQTFKLVAVHSLNGTFEEVNYEPFSWKSWNDGSYQKRTEAYLQENVGFHSWWVKTHNQIDYSLYRGVNTHGVLIGKQDYLYEINYIESTLGMDYVGDSLIQANLRKLKMVEDTLKKQGIQMLIVLAPGKGRYHPEFIPESYDHYERDSTNFDGYLRGFKKLGIPLLDAQTWFNSMKKTTPYPLFAKAGIHWSDYGEFLAADSLVKRVKSMTGKNMPYFVLDGVTVREKNSFDDYDLGNILNLWTRVPTIPMGYPKFHIENKDGEQPKTLVIGDSFYWGLYDVGLTRDFFSDSEYWYYNRTVFSTHVPKDTPVNKENTRKIVESHDLLIIECVDSNMKYFMFGIIDELYDSYFNH